MHGTFSLYLRCRSCYYSCAPVYFASLIRPSVFRLSLSPTYNVAIDPSSDPCIHPSVDQSIHQSKSANHSVASSIQCAISSDLCVLVHPSVYHSMHSALCHSVHQSYKSIIQSIFNANSIRFCHARFQTVNNGGSLFIFFKRCMYDYTTLDAPAPGQ